MIDTKTADRIREYFINNNKTISVGESVTSGLLQLWLSAIPDAEDFYQGGITTYNIGQKYKHLSVEPIHAKNCNCVSEKVSEQMALHVCDLFNSDWGISVTGYATPVEQSKHQLFSYWAISYRGSIKASGKIDCEEMLPQKVQEFYGKEIFNNLVKLLE